MSLCSWVNVVVGKMTGINRSAKYVVVSKERKVPYDYLVLCTGQNYQVSVKNYGVQCEKIISSFLVFFYINGVPAISKGVEYSLATA